MMNAKDFNVEMLLAMRHSPRHNYVVPGLTSWLIGQPAPTGTVRLFESHRKQAGREPEPWEAIASACREHAANETAALRVELATAVERQRLAEDEGGAWIADLTAQLATANERVKALERATRGALWLHTDWLNWLGECDHDVGVCHCDIRISADAMAHALGISAKGEG